ncbi:MAG: sigma-54 interaction domain-containing protein, partial [Luteitalea sp.]
RLARRLATAPALPPATAEAAEEGLVGSSAGMREVQKAIGMLADSEATVLIAGETGTGKEVVARAIHRHGCRAARPFVAVNCAAIPSELLESQLFGHVRGAFTGAATDRAGLFDDADGGTLFLDEVAELGARAQAKLLRVLQDGEVRRVGETQAHRVDVRVIAATNVALDRAVQAGTFRADLFYRLDVVRVHMPALRERREDIPQLTAHLWRDYAARVGCRARLDDSVVRALARHDWPGNVRELQNTLAALAVNAPVRGRVTLADLSTEWRTHESNTAPGEADEPGGLDAARRAFDATFVREALCRAGGRPSAAARDLGLTRQGLTKLVRRLGLNPAAIGSRVP